MKVHTLASVIAAGISISAVTPTMAADTAVDNQELLRRIDELEQKVKQLEQRKAPDSEAAQAKTDELEQKIKVLERKKEIEDEANQAKAKEAPIVRAGKDGFGLRSADGNFDLRLRGYVQADARLYHSDVSNPAPDTFLLRRVRPIVEGTLFKQIGFRIMPDFGGGTTVIQDAYVEGNFAPQFKIRAGKFKPPVGLERLQSGTDLSFVERAFPTGLVPNRDIGIQLSGDILNGAVNYAAGIFNGVVDGGGGDLDSNSNKDYIARLFAEPFKNTELESLRGFGLGLAYSHGEQSGNAATSNLPRYVTPGQQTFFNYLATSAATATTPSVPGAFADGTRERISPQFYYYIGPFGLLGEYVQSKQEVQSRRCAQRPNKRSLATSGFLGVHWRGCFLPRRQPSFAIRLGSEPVGCVRSRGPGEPP